MARQRFPSDEKRARPYVRVHLTLRNHPTYGHVFDDPQLRGMWLGILYVARQAWATETGDEVTLGVGDLYWITGRKDVRRGIFWLEKLCAAMNWELEAVPTSGQGQADVEPTSGQGQADVSLTLARRWRVKVRNLKRKQGPFSAASGSKSKRKRKTAEEEEDSTRSESAPRAPSPEAIEFARKFRASLKGRTPDAKLPSEAAFERWILEADRMYRLDDRKPEEAEDLARWLFNDTGDDAAFWRGNVRAVPKFRTRYEELREHRARGTRKGKRDGGTNLRDAVRGVARRRGLDGGGDGEADRTVRGDAGRLPGGKEPGS